MGDRERTLTDARQALDAEPAIRVSAASGVYETAPVGVVDQPAFLNAVLKVDTDLPPRALLERMLAIEQRFGRYRLRKWGPRTLDLDILLYGDETIDEEGLRVPHPFLHERAFVLVPLCDLNPAGLHPELGRTFRDLAESVGGDGVRAVDSLQLLGHTRRVG